MKRYALITGASSGIGYELAKVFAKHGHPLILVARRGKKLLEAAKEIHQKYHTKVVIIEGDLTKREAALRLYKIISHKGLEVEYLVNNAGIGIVGEFWKTDEEQYRKMLRLNIERLTELTCLFAKDMVRERRGYILNVASTGAYHPGAYTAAYYASKAYVLSFTEAIREELKPYHVEACALCPGATKTGFAKAAGKKESNLAVSPKKVARRAYKGLIKGKKVIFSDIKSACFVKLPRELAASFVKKYQKNMLKNKDV